MIHPQNKKYLAGQRPSQKLACNFRSVSRDKRPSLQIRLARDSNDLVYDIEANSIGNRFKKSLQPQTQLADRPEELKVSKYVYSPFRARNGVASRQSIRVLNTGLSLRNYITTANEYRKNSRENERTAASTANKRRHEDPQTDRQDELLNDYGLQVQPNLARIGQYKSIDLAAMTPNKRQTNLLGLSQFEFNNTIVGRLHSKSNLHLDFARNRTNKITFLNKVWYDSAQVIATPPEIKEKQKYDELQRVHPFKSYSPHKLFFVSKNKAEDANGCGNGGMLDVFYDVDSLEHYEAVHQRTVNNIVDYSNMPERQELPTKLGTQLEYKVDNLKTLGVGNSKRPLLRLARSQRKLVFTRQVISPRLGCCR